MCSHIICFHLWQLQQIKIKALPSFNLWQKKKIEENEHFVTGIIQIVLKAFIRSLRFLNNPYVHSHIYENDQKLKSRLCNVRGINLPLTVMSIKSISCKNSLS